MKPQPRSRVTAQGQISVPAQIRRKFGIGPGTVLEWDDEGDQIVVRRAGRFSSEQIHDAVFVGGEPERRTLAEMKKGIRQHAKARHARG